MALSIDVHLVLYSVPVQLLSFCCKLVS